MTEKKKMQYPAHIRLEKHGESVNEVVQTVEEHCRNTARYAGAALKNAGLEKSGQTVGMIHDCGKMKAEYRTYLEQAVHQDTPQKKTVNHTFAAVQYLLRKYHHESVIDETDIISEILAFAAGAHHGLFDCIDTVRKSGFQHRLDETKNGYDEAIENFFRLCISECELSDMISAASEELNSVLERLETLTEDWDEYCFYLGLLIRLLLSAVIEGDRRDTAEFMNDCRYPEQPEDMTDIWNTCLRRIEKKLDELPGKTQIAQARKEISQRCRDFADRQGGVYRLNVPTGAGKTLSSLRYAAAHAAKYGKRRIIFLSPLLSILDQNAQVIRDFVQDDSLILEHHSNLVRPQEKTEQLVREELMAENWSAPIVITTLVQFLNTLFAGKTTCIRRMQALCSSVIVIDEVQTVPNKMLTIFNLAVNFLSEICGATVVLCSATQPCLEEADHPLLGKPEEMVPRDEEIWKVFRRTQLVPSGSRRLECIPEMIRDVLEETKSLLVICNRKDEAQSLYEQMKGDADSVFHLSANLCMAHRRETLAALYQAIKDGKKSGETVLCISTQVIEAGVDISFGRVIRLLAGMDSVVQAAGRCNRNGDDEISPVYLVNCIDEALGHLREIQESKHASTDLLSEYSKNPDQFSNDPASDEAIEYYYRSLYRDMPENYQDYCIPNKNSLFSLLASNSKYADGDNLFCEKYYLLQAFQTAGKLFQVFDSDTTDILVPYQEGKELISALCSEKAEHDLGYASGLIQQAKPYTVSLYPWQCDKLEKQHALRSVCHDSVLVLEEGFYDENLGLTEEKQTLDYLEVGIECTE